MRVLVVTGWYPSPKQPAASSFVERDVRLIAEKHQVTVLHLIPPSLMIEEEVLEEQGQGLTLLRFPMSRRNPLSIWKAGRWIRQHERNFDLLHTMAFHALLPFSKLFFGKKPATPWVHTEHSSGIAHPESLSKFERFFYKSIFPVYRLPDSVVTVSGFLAARLKEATRVSSVAVIPNIVEPPELISDLNIEEKKVKLIFVGGFIERKDPLTALKTLQVLRKSGIDASITMIGEGSLYSELLNFAQESTLLPYIDFLGSIPHSEVLEEIVKSDIFLVPTKGETFFLGCAEALIHGRPVVVGGSGAHREYVKEPHGYLVPDSLPENYAKAVKKILANRENLSAQTISASIREKFSPDEISTLRESLYKEVIMSRKHQVRT